MSARAGITIGIGMGGFVDGIVLHQLLEWHNMGSSVLPPTTMSAMRQNMIWDGEFHAAAWLITLFGIYLLVADAPTRGIPSRRALSGQLLLGWGIFNLVEGVIDHHVLNVHHVRDLPSHVPILDWLFLVVAGVGFSLAGWAISRERTGTSSRRP